MRIIQFKEANCKNCYKCIRNCPVKAISFKNDQAQVIEEGCVLCGKCLQVCPHNAKSVKNDLENVKNFIDKKLKVYASIAPSFVAAFNIKSEKSIHSVFKKLGFTYVEETAVGAEKVSLEYENIMQKKEMKNIITSACPSIVSLIEKHYPELIPQLAPVVSPMIAHGKMMKALYGSRIKVVFIGPCISKKEEYRSLEKDEPIDAVITFEEFENWMKDENLSFDEEENSQMAVPNNSDARYYPAPGGIIKSLNKRYNYKFLKFDGIERCIGILDEIKNTNIKDYFIEMNSCIGGCLGGVCMNSNCGSFLELREKLFNYINKASSSGSTYNTKYDIKIDLTKNFTNKSSSYIIPDDKVITGLLSKIGKFTKEQELNCGACGYDTCRDKCIAVYNNKADLRMCLPYMREGAESISNVIIHSTPNAIFALNQELLIQQVNMSARKLFKLECSELQNRHVFDILNCPEIYVVSNTKKDILDQKYYYRDYGVIVEQSILYIKENQMIIVVMRDVTKYEKQQQQLHNVRCETVEIAQKVIDKQMRVAQEIASLLGETTAETKVALTKLKKSIQSEIGDDI